VVLSLAHLHRGPPRVQQGLLPRGMVYDVFRAAVPSKHDLKEKPAKKLVRGLFPKHSIVPVTSPQMSPVLPRVPDLQAGTIRFGKDSAATAAKVWLLRRFVRRVLVRSSGVLSEP
jgi:hypothetical protein